VSRWVRWLAMALAPGDKPGADSPPVCRDTMRFVAFSDGIFAITITLLILDIRPPTDDTNLLHGLVALWPSYLAYALTFLFVGQVWANHHVMFDHIRAADRVVLLLKHPAADGRGVPSFRYLSPCRGAAQRTQPANRRRLLRHHVRRDGA
jgi:hypothetical protein